MSLESKTELSLDDRASDLPLPDRHVGCRTNITLYHINHPAVPITSTVVVCHVPLAPNIPGFEQLRTYLPSP
jgi:hypothetical protein